MADPELTAGLAAGTLATAALLGIVLVARDRRIAGPLPLGGAAIVVAALWAIAQERPLPADLVVGTLGVSTACALSGRRWSTWAVLALAAPFAYVLARDISTTTWIQVAVLLGATVGATAVARTEEAWREEAVTPALLAITAAGVFAAVPDTEEAAALLGAAVPVLVLGWPLRLVTLGRAGAGGATALLVWVIAVGGRGRPPSIVGALACIGLLLTLGLPWWPSRPRGWAPAGRVWRGWPVVLALAAHAGIVVLASRGAGIRDDLSTAVPLAVVSAVAAVAAGAALARWTPSARPD